MVPRAPLENDIPLRIQFLKNRSRNQGGGVAVGNHLAHINFAQVIAYLQDVAVGQQLKIVRFSHITITTLDGLDDVMIFVQNLMDDIAASRIGEGFNLLGVMEVA